MASFPKSQYLLDLEGQQITEICLSLSAARFNAYRRHVASDRDALALYEINQRLAALVFQLIGDFEVALRNAVVGVLEAHVNDDIWFRSPSLRSKLQKHHIQHLEMSMRQLEQQERTPDSDKMCAAMNFGFWLTFYSGELGDEFWNRYLSLHWPKGSKLKVLRVDLNQVRQMRNRIAHQEAIYTSTWRQQPLNVLLQRFEQLSPAMFNFAYDRFAPGYRTLDKQLLAAGL